VEEKTEMKWGAPPPAVPKSNLHAPKAAAMRERPGEWGEVGTYGSESSAASMARTIRTGQVAAWKPAGAFEATSRGCVVYARYVGESDE